MKKIISLLLTLILALGALVSCSSKEEEQTASGIDAIKEAGVVRIGVFSDKPPFGFVDEKGENQGYDVYLAKRIAKDLLGDESKVEFVLVEAANRVEYLQSNKVDIILANFTQTPEREEVVDFAKAYMKVDIGVVSPDGSPIKSIDDLKGKQLIVNKGTTAEAFFTKNYPEIELVGYEQNTEAFNALLDGRGAALAHDNTLLFAWARENKGFTTYIDSLGDESVIAPAVKKGNTELKEWLDEEITKLTQEGFFREAYDATLLPAFGDTVDPASVIIE
ncbi:cysteine ABC transporter substrate-binding protein [Clostridium isatidis]|uniref:ABC transporter substrate-binding protein n=1 Tax=Clostridium isatidis TaxID=182773 RepID=A0A343JCY3_9CLOT|nr:cysteine ABC transporter substrate-binding protein [Clostridium isatidis]ASW43391.1 ABC transporter substrate-binding protein [Clostridium isatidis]NLZ33906.1 transporter substrate-binding domain-containing protein [Clostridiales bacterium]